MAEFGELTGFLTDSLDLPVRGKAYQVPAVDWETGLVCQALWNTILSARAGADGQSPRDKQVLDDAGELELFERVLGPVFAEAKADKVPWTMLRHMGLTVFYWTVVGEEAASAHWQGSTGKASARRAAASRSTAGAPTTKRPASTSGTKSRRKS